MKVSKNEGEEKKKEIDKCAMNKICYLITTIIPLFFGIDVKQFLPLFKDIEESTKKILEAYNNAQINKRDCTTLVNRAQEAVMAIRTLVRNKHESEEKFKDKS